MPQPTAISKRPSTPQPSIIPTEISVAGKLYRIIPVEALKPDPQHPDRGLTEALTIGLFLGGGLIVGLVLLRALFPPVPVVPPPPPRPVIIRNPPAVNPNCVAFCGVK